VAARAHVLLFVEMHALSGSGLSVIDAHLTRDRRLRLAADILSRRRSTRATDARLDRGSTPSVRLRQRLISPPGISMARPGLGIATRA
jgi:hypothetical protein